LRCLRAAQMHLADDMWLVNAFYLAREAQSFYFDCFFF
jgi:hypothetical protein